MAKNNLSALGKLSIVSTVIDAGLAFYRGRHKRGAMLLGAAVVSARLPGAGTAASVLTRLIDRRTR